MKVIDLLNKIAKNEEVPKELWYQGRLYKYIEDNNIAYRYTFTSPVQTLGLISMVDSLNDEIEIIEEKPKKIEEAKFKRFEETGEAITYQRVMDYNDFNIKELKRVTDELTKAVNYLLEKESDK